MAITFNVAGPVLIRTSTGVNSALENLGFSEDGVRVQVQEFTNPVKTDVAGDAPADVQAMGTVGHISGRISAFDDAIVMKLLARMAGVVSDTDGVTGVLGTLYQAGSLSHRLILVGANKIYRFNTAKLEGAFDTKIGTKYTVNDMRWFAWAPITAALTTPNGVVLYDHTNA